MAFKLTDYSRGEYNGGINIIASEQRLAFIEEGATLDATAFPVGYNGVGRIIRRDDATGKYVPVTETEGVLDGTDDIGIVNVDFDNDGENDIHVGEVIIAGSVYADKMADEATDAIKAATPLIRYIHNPAV